MTHHSSSDKLEVSRVERMIPMDRLMTVRQTVEYSGLSENMLRNWIKQGKCPGIRNGNRFLVNVDMLEKQIQEESARK